MSEIVQIVGREVLDSRGNPTVEVEVLLETGAHGAGHRAVAARRPASTRPSSCATAGHRYGGKGVHDAVANVNERDRRRQVEGYDALDQRLLDQALLDLDGTDNKARLGANAILGVSLAVARAAAGELELPLYRYVGGPNAHVLPVPMMNVLNGGVHADNNVDFQEFMVMPVGAAELPRGAALGRRDVPRAEGRAARARACRPAWATRAGSRPTWPRTRSRCRPLVEAIEAAGYTPGEDIAIALDPAASELYRDGAYHLEGEGQGALVGGAGRLLGGDGRSLPDRVHRGRHGRGRLGRLGRAHRRRSAAASSSWATTSSSPTPSGWPSGIERGVANSVLVKVNQIGTLTETLDTVELATRNAYTSVISHRSGRDRGHHHRRPRRGHQLRPDQDRRARPAPTGWPSTTSCCASRTTSTRRPPSSGGAALARGGAGR